MEFDNDYQISINPIRRKAMKTIQLPYVRIYTNKYGAIEILSNLNNTHKEECEALASFLSNNDDTSFSSKAVTIPTDIAYERALEEYSTPINVEFKCSHDSKGCLSYEWPKEVHPKLIIMALRRKAEKVLAEAINGLAT